MSAAATSRHRSGRRFRRLAATAAATGTLLVPASASPAAAEGPGSLVAWGFNNAGQLGNGNTAPQLTPLDVPLPAGVSLTKVVGSSRNHSLAITSDGLLLAWGSNNQGQLGDGTTTQRTTPVPVDLAVLQAGETITDIGAGEDTSYAVTSLGRALSWGNGLQGNLGIGSTSNSNVPVAVSLPAGVSLQAVRSGYNYGLGLTTDGRVVAWGQNNFGQLGDGTTTQRTTPVFTNLTMLAAGETITDIAAMSDHNLALTSTGRIIAWGNNQFGQLGDASTTQRTTPVFVALPAGTTVSAIGVGWDHSLAVTSTGGGLAWGNDSHGQLGNDGTRPATTSSPSAIILPAGVSLATVDGGIDHSVALTTDGRVLAWGYGGSGQMGDGTNEVFNDVPGFVILPAGTVVDQVDAGEYMNLAVATVPPLDGSPMVDPRVAAVVLLAGGGGTLLWRRRRSGGVAEVVAT